jgi:hypothetical protein
VLLLAAPIARAERPRLRCEAVQLGRRTVARADLMRFFDGEMLRLVRLGLEGRVRLDIRLMRSRTAWFDDVVGSFSQDLAVTWDGERRRYLLNGVAVHPSSLDPLEIDRIPLGRRDRDDDLYVEVSAKLQVVTFSSLRARPPGSRAARAAARAWSPAGWCASSSTI